MILSAETQEILQALGSRLRQERLRRDESQQVFATRIGTSIPTLKKMETGDPRVQLVYWVAALEVLDRQAELQKILSPPEDLFAKYARAKQPERQRARKKKKNDTPH